MSKQKGSIYVTSECDMGKLIAILCNNDYEVKVKQTASLDAFFEEYKIDFERTEDDEP